MKTNRTIESQADNYLSALGQLQHLLGQCSQDCQAWAKAAMSNDPELTSFSTETALVGQQLQFILRPSAKFLAFLHTLASRQAEACVSA